MNSPYLNMRHFWLDIKNMENRQGIVTLGEDHIAIAGVEMAVADGTKRKHIFVATNSLGDSSLYFENNSKSGLGGIIGGHDNQTLQTASTYLLTCASKLTRQMQAIPAGSDLPAPTKEGYVRLFALSKEKLFHIEILEIDARKTENPFYPFFAYSQQMLGAFRTQTEGATARA